VLISKLVIKNILRSPTRSLFTFVGTFASAFLFSIGLSWLHGVYDNLISSTIATNGHIRIVSEAYFLREMTYPIEEHLPHVEQITERIQSSRHSDIQVFSIIKQKILVSTPKNNTSQMSLYVASSKEYRSQLFSQSNCQSTVSHREGLTIGSQLATQLQVHIHDDIILLGRTVDGSFSPKKIPIQKIIHCDNYLINEILFVDLEIGEYMIDVEDAATELIVFDETGKIDTSLLQENLEDIEIRNSMNEPTSFVLEPWYQRHPLADILPLSLLMNGIFGVLLTVMVVVSIVNPMMMMIWERKQEFLLLRALGFSKSQIIWILLLENLILTTCALFISITFGYFWISTQSIGIDISDSVSGLPQSLPFSTRVIPLWDPIQIPLLVLGFGYFASILGTFVPLYRLLRIIQHPYEILRSIDK
jgi:putative ABC transport system permease protein